MHTPSTRWGDRRQGAAKLHPLNVVLCAEQSGWAARGKIASTSASIRSPAGGGIAWRAGASTRARAKDMGKDDKSDLSLCTDPAKKTKREANGFVENWLTICSTKRIEYGTVCSGLYTSATTDNPAVERIFKVLEALLVHPLFWGVVALLALAIPLTGKPSVSGASWLLWIAYLAAVFGVFRSGLFRNDPAIRFLSVLIVAGILAVGAVILQRWFQGRPLITKASPAAQATGAVAKGIGPSGGSGGTPVSAPATGMVTMTESQFRELMGALRKEPQPTVTANVSSSPLNSDLRYVFYGKDRLYVVFKNPSRYVASKPKVWFALMDLTNPYSYSIRPGESPTAQPFPIPTKVYSDDYVRPGDSGGNEDLLRNFMGHIKEGDIIWGFAAITCIDCMKQRSYYVYWKAGVGGWFAEADPKHLMLPKPVMTPFSESQIDAYVNKLVPAEDRQQMKETLGP